MTKTAQEGGSLGAKMSAKELAGYEWKGMSDEEGRALFEGSESIKVTVGIGSNQKTWYLPKKVLTHCSPFFNAALNGDFVEGHLKALSLPEDDPLAFEMWATWLSLGKCKDAFSYCDYDHAYVRAWILGDKFACPAFKDHVMSQFFDEVEDSGYLWLDTVQVAYEISPPGSKIRRLFVDWFSWYKLHGQLAEDSDRVIMFLRELPEFSDNVVRREMMAGKEIVKYAWEEKHRYYENPAFKPDAWDSE